MLQSCRATGWLSYRPDSSGQLTRADSQHWARVHSEKAGRVSDKHLANRYSWLDHEGKPTLALSGPTVLPQWVSECELPQLIPQPQDVFLDWEAAFLPASEMQATLQLLLHPRDRLSDTVEQALGKLTPQSTKNAALAKHAGKQVQMRAKNKLAKKRCRKELAADWRHSLGAAGSAQKRLLQLPPEAKGKKKPSLAAKNKHKTKLKALKRKR